MSEYQWGQLLLMATTIGGFLVAEWRASRNRRWAIEDRERNAAEAISERKNATAEIIARAAAEAEATRIKTEAIAATLRRHTETTAAKLREEARIGADELVHQAAVIASELQTVTAAAVEEQRKTSADLADKVADATVAAKDAYKEANNVNIKIEDLNQRLMQVAQVPAAAGKKIEKIDATTERIEAKVDADASSQGR